MSAVAVSVVTADILYVNHEPEQFFFTKRVYVRPMQVVSECYSAFLTHHLEERVASSGSNILNHFQGLQCAL